MNLQENMTFDSHYTLIRQLGRGGFSEVWLAHDSYMGIDVAIKIYAPGQGMDPNSINEFRREITGVFQLNHSNLLCPKHLGIWENMPYLIMAYCPAGSCLKFVGNISESEIWHLIHDVAAGLAYLHEKDIVHQDIKPDNILIDTEGNYLITDFGISTRARSTLRKSVMSTHTSAGTLAYMGPERFSEQPAPTKASDIWSLGAMLFELLEGKTPFPADFGGGMQKAGAELPCITANVSNELKLVIEKMLSLNTWDRPTADTLVQWAKNPAVIEQPTRYTKQKNNKISPKTNQLPQPTSKPWVLIVLGLFIAIGAGVLGILIAEKEHRNELASQIYVDLGLPSGTLWKNANEGGDNARYTYDEAVSRWGSKLPTKEQLVELKNKCRWKWTTRKGVYGYKGTGPNGNSIFLPAAGYHNCDGDDYGDGVLGYYWSSTPHDSDNAWYLNFVSSKVYMDKYRRCGGRSVRLVQN